MTTSTKSITSATMLVVTATGSKYNPSASTAQNNADSWALIKSVCGAKGATYGAIQKALKDQYNHAPMAGYCVRRGWLKAK